MSTKVFVTGSTGFVGFATLKRILENGHSVRALVRRQEAADLIRQKLPSYKDKLEIVLTSGSIEVESTFDGKLQDITHIVHIASPLPGGGTDFQKDLINPAINGTLSVLKAASKVPSVKRVVITSSVASVLPSGNEAISKIDESHWAKAEPGQTYASAFEAYAASKTLAEKAVWEYQEEHKPSYDIITILPSFVTGRNELVGAGKDPGGSNSITYALLFKGATQGPGFSSAVHIDDVADAHANALDPKVPGNSRYLISTNISWNDAIEVAKAYKPDYDGWNFGSYSDTPLLIDSSKAVKELGIEFKSYKDAVTGLLDGYFGN